MKISHGKLLCVVHLNWAAFILSTSFNNSNKKEEAEIITNDISLRLIFFTENEDILQASWRGGVEGRFLRRGAMHFFTVDYFSFTDFIIHNHSN